MLTVDETALLIWRLLETQGKCGCTWETFKEVPNELKQIVPVERRLLRVRKQDSTVVLTPYREYTESAAQKLQEHIQFDVVAALRRHGYSWAFKQFNKLWWIVCRCYDRWCIFLSYFFIRKLSHKLL